MCFWHDVFFNVILVLFGHCVIPAQLFIHVEIMREVEIDDKRVMVYLKTASGYFIKASLVLIKLYTHLFSFVQICHWERSTLAGQSLRIQTTS